MAQAHGHIIQTSVRGGGRQDAEIMELGEEREGQWHLIMSLAQGKQNNGFLGVQNKYSDNMAESTTFLMIMLQKYPFLHKFLDEESSMMY